MIKIIIIKKTMNKWVCPNLIVDTIVVFSNAIFCKFEIITCSRGNTNTQEAITLQENSEEEIKLHG